tara:strand:- start:15094 stop:15696 length:603 start_codon:yes stop_codon:yes gene_type:complete
MEEILTVENYCNLLVFKENYDILKKLKTNEINSIEKTLYYKEISYKLTILSSKFNNLSLTENNRLMIDNILKINNISEKTNIKIEENLNVDNNFLYKKKMPNIKKEKNSLDLIELSLEDDENEIELSEDNNSNSEFSENEDLIYVDDKSVDDWQDNNWQECVDNNSDDDENNLKSINLSPYTETEYFTNRGRKTQKIKYF